MKTIVKTAALAACAAGLLLATGAQAQYGAAGGGSIRCESDDGRARSCPTPWRGRSQLVRQLSNTACVEGRNWQSRGGQVSVDSGCRGEFTSRRDDMRPPVGNGATVRCESENGRVRTCPTAWRGRSQLVRQISGNACIEGRSWQSRGGQITVSGGCRGEFAAERGGGPVGGGGGSIRCESDDNRSRTCTTPWRGQSVLLRQVSGSPCIEGRTWQGRGGQVTVNGGCRGEFGPR